MAWKLKALVGGEQFALCTYRGNSGCDGDKSDAEQSKEIRDVSLESSWLGKPSYDLHL